MNEVVRNPLSKLVLHDVPEDLASYCWVMRCVKYYREHWEQERPYGPYHGVIYTRGDLVTSLFMYKTKTSIVVRYSTKE